MKSDPNRPSAILRSLLAATLLAASPAASLVAQTVAAPPRPSSSASTRPVDAALVARLQGKLDSIHAAATFPGATAAVALPDGRVIELATGRSDTTRRVAMRTADRMLSGSVGKTYVAAVALQLVGEGRLRLDDPIARHLGAEPWFARLPNARDVTVRMLMNHTSGLVRYELNERFLADLSANPDRVWTAAERLSYLLDSRAPFAAGQGWDYSDSNYIVLGDIIERVTGRPLYEEVERRVLRPLALANTVPSDSRRINGLAQGYAGPANPFGGTDAMIAPDGRFAINPQFEWAGGGFASTAGDLARWGKALYEGRAFPRALLDTALVAVPAPMLGREAKYGLGVIVRPTPLGITWGHSGYMPGYLTELRYWPEHGIAVALQVNTTAQGAMTRGPGAIVHDLAGIVVEGLRN
jgi:D-alanyl-D-alanine carboxypeptidase